MIAMQILSVIMFMESLFIYLIHMYKCMIVIELVNKRRRFEISVDFELFLGPGIFFVIIYVYLIFNLFSFLQIYKI